MVKSYTSVYGPPYPGRWRSECSQNHLCVHGVHLTKVVLVLKGLPGP
jgi:hypothetical protein